MALRFYNTLTQQVEPFSPLQGNTVRMYTCVPTVYNYAHIGNFRTFTFEDILRRWLLYRGYQLDHVMNITDVEDKIIRNAAQEKKTLSEYTEQYTKAFLEDTATLRLQRPERLVKATEHIEEMVRCIQDLTARGCTYTSDGSVYYRISKFPGYGKLSRLDTREVKSGARVLQDDYTKENAQDFALWKAAKPEDERSGAAWDSPWGRGRPGWHLECSAMAMDLLGETLDLHGGGIDLIFPHHEDEIAQSEAATGKPFSRFWCHGAFLLTEGAKMAKRVGNVLTVEGLRESGQSAAALRHFVFNTHYRKELNLSDEALEASQQGVRRVGDFYDRLYDPATLSLVGTPELATAADEAVAAAEAALFDDLNGPEALAALFNFIRRANAELDRHGGDRGSGERARAAFERINGVLDVVPERAAADPTLTSWIEERIGARRDARARRDFGEADRIRAELTARGVAIEDAGGETRWKLVRAT